MSTSMTDYLDRYLKGHIGSCHSNCAKCVAKRMGPQIGTHLIQRFEGELDTGAYCKEFGKLKMPQFKYDRLSLCTTVKDR